MRAPARSSAAGLTLIELMVVVAILAILATLAVPSFTSFMTARQLNGAASQLMSDLQNARSEAVARNATVLVTFTSANYTLSSGGTSIRSVTFSGGTSVSTGSNAVISYDPRRGTASSPNNTNAVTLVNSTHSLQITVLPMGRLQCTALTGAASC